MFRHDSSLPKQEVKVYETWMTFWNCLIYEWPELDSCFSLRPPSEQDPITFSGLIQNNILSWSYGMARPEDDKIQANQSYWWKILRDTFVRQCEIRLRRMIAISSHSFLAIVAFGPCQRWLVGCLSWQEQFLWEVGERRPPTIIDWHNDIIKEFLYQNKSNNKCKTTNKHHYY